MADEWEASDCTLHEACINAIKRFAREHSDADVCGFFLDCDEPRYGHLTIAFDTLENNIRTAKELEQFAIESREKNLRGNLTWEWAKYQLGSPVLSPFNTNSGGFAFPQFAEVDFPSWIKLAQAGSYPKGLEHDDDYLESNARLVMWRVAEQLVAVNAFAVLNLASPFMIGYSIHDQEEVILRMLNWPKIA